MIIVMKKNSQKEEILKVSHQLQEAGFHCHLVEGTEKTIIGAVGDKSRLMNIPLEALPCVEKVIPILAPYKLTSREFKPEDTLIRVGNITIGGSELQVIAGPCAVEGKEELLLIAQIVKQAGASILRGGAFKPRTSPYSFQGLGEKGLQYLALAREKTGLPIVTEVIDTASVDLVAYYADIIQIGARNMHNYALLKKAAKTNKPILLKRGLSATIEEWILAAEYIITADNPHIILCERGIRTFETYTRNTLDLSAVPIIKYLTHLPIIVDPSHGTGKWRWVSSMAQAAVAAGADGLMLEVHPCPEKAFSDGAQSLNPDNFQKLMTNLNNLAPYISKKEKLNHA
ncbi:MAG TPA: 3-deoxy-7-phosphoheptulonate synthase [Clostridia bacterium]|jgi:3-deoxy-7-phosphoheptulonate synthase|nr:3-deoxy-7-phosphoheptulonate synthase [Clostridia bacterium]HHY05453.1 3-deoxy-7-phosphoheptulonate synthase [Clostridia bacterium]